MGLRESLRNIRYFFQWLGEVFRTWFLPYHYNEGEELGTAETEGATAPSAEAASLSTEPAQTGQEAVATASPAAKPDLAEVMAFRGAMTKTALAAVVKEDLDQVAGELDSLVASRMAEDLGDGRYLLVESERRRMLRADPRVADWLSRLQHAQLENDTLDILEELCRRLPVKITVGQSLVLHLRQRKWMVWQSREENCRARLFGTLNREQWSDLRSIDKRARRLRRKEPHRWDARDWVTFRWRVGADHFAIESLLLESG